MTGCLQMDVGNSSAKWRLVEDGHVTVRGRYLASDAGSRRALLDCTGEPGAIWIASVAGEAAEACGCFALVLECVPSELAARVTERVGIPTIGIGAGTEVDGQVLVLHDLAGFSPDFQPRFARVFRPGAQHLQEAVAAFAEAVRSGDFPTEDEAYR